MSRRLWPGLLVGGWALFVTYAQAQEAAPRPTELPDATAQRGETPVPPAPKPKPTPAPAPAPAPAPVAEPAPACEAPCPEVIEKHLSGLNLYLRPVERATTLPKITLRPEEVARLTRVMPTLDWNEQRFTRTELELKPRKQVQDVVCTKVEPTTEVDCNGCAHTVYKTVPVVRQVEITVYDVVPVEKAYLLRTPFLKPVPENVIVRKLAADLTQEPAIETRLEAIPAPWEANVPVPVPQPLPPPAPPACLPH